MPLRGGESVGSAYVRIYADGSEVPGDIRRAMQDSEPAVREEGRKHGEAYGEEFEVAQRKSFKTHFGKGKNEMFRDLDTSIKDSIARLDLADDFLKSPAWRKFTEQVTKAFGGEMGDAARLAMKDIEREFRDTGDFDVLNARMKRIGVTIRQEQAKIVESFNAKEREAWNKMFDEALADNKAFDNRWRDIIKRQDDEYERHIDFLRDVDRAYAEDKDRMLSEAYRMNKAFDKLIRQEQRDAVRDNRLALIQFRNNMKEIQSEIAKLQRGTARLGSKDLDLMLQRLRAIAPHLSASSHQIGLFNDRLDVMHRNLRLVNPRLEKLDRNIITVGDSMGRLFGKGSRNDFINFFGSVVRGLTQLPRLLLFVSKPFVELFGKVKDAAASGGPMKALGVAIGGIGIIAAKAGAAVLGFAIFIGFIGVVAGPVVSILSGLLGIIAALASTLIYAAGAAGAFLPLIVPIAAIIGGIVAAVMDLKDATGALGRQLDDISDKSTKLWDRFKEGVGDSEGLGRVLDEVNRALSRMGPFIDAAIKGFNRFAGAIADEMQGGAFDKFTDRFARFLPHAMRDLGVIFGNVIGGIAGILRGAIPSANTLLENLVDITDRFDEWANSKKGQQQIKDFFEDAVESADKLGGFVEDVWFFMKKIVREGKESGDKIWENMGNAFEDATKFFEENPDALEEWFKHAEDTATQIGDIIDAIILLADTLDSESSRVEQMYLFKGLTFFISTLATQIRIVEGAFKGIFYILGGQWVGDLFDGISDGLNAGSGSDWWAAIQRWGDGVQSRLSQLGKDIWYVIGGQWIGDLVDGIQDALRSVGGLFSGGGGGLMMIRPNVDLSGVLSTLGRLPGRVRQLLQPVVGAFQGLAERAARAAGDLAGRVAGRLAGLAGRVQQFVDQAVARFGNMAERIARTIGDLWGQISSRFTSIPGNVAGVVTNIVNQFRGLAGRILSMIGDIVIRPRVQMPVIGDGAAGRSQQLGPQNDESGAPNGSRVANDDALRIVASGSAAITTSGASGKFVSADGWTIVTPSENPRIVATEVINELIARAV